MSRYLERHNFDPDVIERAESIVERYLGHQMATTEYTEASLRIDPVKGAFFLRHRPFVGLVSVQARSNYWGSHFDYGRVMGSTKWIDIDLEHIVLHTNKVDGAAAIVLPGTVFGSRYDEATVVYRAGLVEIPTDIQQAVQTVAELIERGAIDDWNYTLPTEVHDVLLRYRKEGPI